MHNKYMYMYIYKYLLYMYMYVYLLHLLSKPCPSLSFHANSFRLLFAPRTCAGIDICVHI